MELGNKKDHVNFLFNDFENHLESFITNFLDDETQERFSHTTKKYGDNSYIMYAKLIYGTDCILINANSIYENTIYELFNFMNEYSKNPIENLSIIFIYEHFIDKQTIDNVNKKTTINDILTGLDNTFTEENNDEEEEDEDEEEMDNEDESNSIKKNSDILSKTNLGQFLKSLRDPLNPPYIFNVTNDYYYIDSPKIVNRLANMGSVEFELTLVNNNNIIDDIAAQIKKVRHQTEEDSLLENFSSDISKEMSETIKSCFQEDKYVNRNGSQNSDIRKNIAKTFVPYYKVKSITGLESDYVKVEIIIYIPPTKSLSEVEAFLKLVYNEIRIIKKTRGWLGRKLNDENVYYEITNEKKDSNLLLDNKFKRSSIYSLGSPFPESVFKVISNHLNNIVED